MRRRNRVLMLAAALSLPLVLAGCDRGGTGGRDAPAGVTGNSAPAAGGQASRQPGTGLQGGLGTNSMGAASSPAGTSDIPSGSKNRTTGGSVGNR